MNTKLRIIVFGTGKAAENFLLKSAKENEILAFADNDKNKQNKSFKGYKVIAPERINDYEFDQVLICSTFLLQIHRQLTVNLGINSQKVVAGPKTAIFSNKTIEPFRDENTRKLGRKVILFLSELFDESGIPYFIDHGTLLGIIRDQDLIHWDDDIDISVQVEDGELVMSCLKENLNNFPMGDIFKWSLSLTYIEKASYEVDFGKRSESGNLKDLHISGVKPLGLSLDFVERDISGINPFRISIVFNHFSDGMVYQSVNYAPEVYFLQADTLEFMGRKIKVPHDPKGYLKFHYGEDWKIPRKMTSYLELKNFREPEAPGRFLFIAESLEKKN